MRLREIRRVRANSVGLRPSRSAASTAYRARPIAPPPLIVGVHYFLRHLSNMW